MDSTCPAGSYTSVANMQTPGRSAHAAPRLGAHPAHTHKALAKAMKAKRK
jgi:hypothetical protein